ncbi:hypothetical protein [Janthinobacterium sp. RB2R34]|uniref:hypothetical protein n=1 Tax=Janthinobacterium sp. RB2R34 TaxID=3424193 RepID=UPI003F1EE82E
MKKILLVFIVAVIALYAFKRLVVEPYLWKRAISTPEHQLQMGSFIFSKQSGHNGSQSMENQYFIFRVTEIQGDHVRLAVVRQLRAGDQIVEGDFSTTKKAYGELKDNINSLVATGISRDDLYGRRTGRDPLQIDAYLLEKYPALKTSRYYFEDVPAYRRNRPVPQDQMERSEYFSLVYSKKEIIEHGRLVAWILNNSPEPELSNRSEKIDLILNRAVGVAAQ